MRWSALFVAVCLLPWCSVGVRVGRLRCNSQERPLVVMHDAPIRLSWEYESEAKDPRNIRQDGFKLEVSLSNDSTVVHSAHSNSSLPHYQWRVPVSLRKQMGVHRSRTLYWRVKLLWSLPRQDSHTAESPWSPTSHFTLVARRGNSVVWVRDPDLKAASGNGSTMLRTEFELSKPVHSAVLSLSGLGFYELHINGVVVGDQVLDAGWTNYNKTCLYATHNVTQSLKPGANAIGVWLGNGMYNVPALTQRYNKFVGSFGPRRLWLELDITFADGSSHSVQSAPGSGIQWKVKPSPGPVVFTHIYGGEDYDARLEAGVQGWDTPGFNDSSWVSAHPDAGPGCALSPQTVPARKVMASFDVVGVTEPQPGVFVYDMGQNVAGWMSIVVSGPAGSRVVVYPGEVVNSPGNGLVNQSTMGANPSTPNFFSYVLRGRGNETWHPRFSYHGMRYLQVMGAAPPGSAAGSGVVLWRIQTHWVHSSAERVGHFESSNRVYNGVHHAIVAAISSNLQSIHTDCPHREKLGWAEVGHHMFPSVAYNFDIQSLYSKIAGDLREAQNTTSGLEPDIAPEYTVFRGGFLSAPNWGSSLVLVPWMLYKQYGDPSALNASYPYSAKYADFLGDTAAATGGIVEFGLGDWCDPPASPQHPTDCNPIRTPVNVTSTAEYYLVLRTLSASAAVLGLQTDSAHWGLLANKTAQAFRAAFVDPTSHNVATGSQGSLGSAIFLGLVDATDVKATVQLLVDNVRSLDTHLSTGEITHRSLYMALAHNGHAQVVADMLSQQTFPSEGYWLLQGATSALESWSATHHASWDHDMFGHAEEFFYAFIGGIRLGPLGSAVDALDTDSSWAHVIVAPEHVRQVHWARASYRSNYGLVRSEWDIVSALENRTLCCELHHNVSVPPNVHASVVLPALATPCAHIAAGEHSKWAAWEADVPRSALLEDAKTYSTRSPSVHRLYVEVGSGFYSFVSHIPCDRSWL